MNQPVKLRWLANEIDHRAGTATGHTLLSVSMHHGVIPRSIAGGGQSPSEDLVNYKLCEPGDIVLNRMRLFQGALGITPAEGLVSPDYAVMRTTRLTDPRYLAYLMRSDAFVAEMTSRLRGIGSPDASGVRTPRVNVADLREIAVSVPAVDQQRRIADFLDDQTTRIDQIIAARTTQIELLNQELVRELDDMLWRNPDSVPVKLLATDVTSGPRGWGDLVGEEGERLFLRIGNLPKLGISPVLTDVFRVTPPESAEAHRARVAADDVLIGITASIGEVALIDGSLAGSAFSQHVARIRPRPSVNSQWLAWALQSHRVRAALTTAAYGGTKVALSLAEVREVQVPLCSERAQHEIAVRARATFGGWLGTTSRLERSIELMQEVKRSLVSSAVSGEFDVSASIGRGLAV